MAGRRQIRLRFTLPSVPDVLAADADGSAGDLRMPALEWLVARGREDAAPAGGWRDWLLEGAGAPHGLHGRLAAGPCVRATQAPSCFEGNWACARPVHLLTAIDHLQFATETIVLGLGETDVLANSLNAHFADRGFRFHVGRSGLDWVLQCPTPIACSSLEPAGHTGRNLRDLLPGGTDGPLISSLMNEIQMLLHEHPVNLARMERGLPVVNSLWLWGFGTAARPVPAKLPSLYTDDAWLAGFWTVHGMHVSPIEDFARDLANLEGAVRVAWSHPGSASAQTETMTEVERLLCGPARAALRAGHVGQAEILLGRRVFRVGHRDALRFWRRTRPIRATFA